MLGGIVERRVDIAIIIGFILGVALMSLVLIVSNWGASGVPCG